MAEPTHPTVFIGKIYPEVSPPLQYSALIYTRSRMVASDPGSTCPRYPEMEPWSSPEEAMLRARRIAAFQGSLLPDNFSEVMGGNNQEPDSSVKKVFRGTESKILTEMYGKSAFITGHVFGIYSTIHVQVWSKF
jgi:hypothetical protein